MALGPNNMCTMKFVCIIPKLFLIIKSPISRIMVFQSIRNICIVNFGETKNQKINV